MKKATTERIANGFRDRLWGDSPAGLPPSGGLQRYGMDMTMDLDEASEAFGFPIGTVYYLFYRKRLCSVEIDFVGWFDTRLWAKLRAAISESCGQHEMVDASTYRWTTEDGITEAALLATEEPARRGERLLRLILRDIERTDTDEQRLAFRHHVHSHRLELDGTIQRHQGREIESYKQSTMMSAAERFGSSATAAILVDPESTRVNIFRQEGALRDLAKMRGLGPEASEYFVATARSKTHYRNLAMLLSAKRDIDASKYFEGNKDQFVGEDLVHAQAAVEEGSTLGEAQRATDRIFAPTFKPIDKGILAGSGLKAQSSPGAQNMSDVLKQTEKIENPKVRKVVEALSRQRLNDREDAIKGESESVFMEITKRMEQRPDMDPRFLATPDEWENKLLPAHKDSLKRMAAKPENDDAAWIEWITLQADPEKIAALTPAEFYSKYHSRFGTRQKTTAEEEWKRARVSRGKGDGALDIKSAFNDKELVLNAIKGVGYAGFSETETFETIGNNAQKAKAFRELVDKAEDQYKAWAYRNKKAPDDIEKKRILADLLFRHTQVDVAPDPMSFGAVLGEIVPFVGAFTYRPYRKSFGDLDEDERKAFMVPMESIPSARVEEIRNLLLNNRRVVTNDKVQRIRKAQLLNDDQSIVRILSESP